MPWFSVVFTRFPGSTCWPDHMWKRVSRSISAVPSSYWVRDIDFILNLAARHGTRLIATSVQEHCSQTSYLRERLTNVGAIQSVYGTGWSTEYPMHFHIQWAILRALGYDVDRVSVIT